MVIPVTFIFGAFGYLYYKSLNKVSLVKSDQLDTQNDQVEDDDLYKDLGDLFI